MRFLKPKDLSLPLAGVTTRGLRSGNANRRSTLRAIGGLEPGWGLTVLRIAMGLVFAVHGYAKFAMGLGKTSAFFAKVSIPLPELMGPVIAVLELIGGMLLVLGWGD